MWPIKLKIVTIWPCTKNNLSTPGLMMGKIPPPSEAFLKRETKKVQENKREQWKLLEIPLHTTKIALKGHCLQLHRIMRYA